MSTLEKILKDELVSQRSTDFTPRVKFLPSVDGEFFTSNPLAATTANPVDLVVGFNSDGALRPCPFAPSRRAPPAVHPAPNQPTSHLTNQPPN